MAMSRAEIELLIKARSDADKTFQGLSDKIKGVTGESGKATTAMSGFGTQTKTTGTAAIATGVVIGQLAERLAVGLVSAFNSTIAAANRLDAGLIGLRSVANAFKQDAGAAEDAAKALARDGLLSVGDAATGLKNLLSAGFGLPEAVTLMGRFKDSAAFGRQGALDFGQAIVGATEGIKNGNSALVDNAGVTKNLSVILTEAGLSASDLGRAQSDLGVRTAIYNGILKETNPQLGDAARYLDTAAGKQAQFSAQVEIAQQKLGKELQPALAATLEALVPFVQLAGDLAPVLVPAGLAIGGLVGPLVAVRGAAALGIIEMGSLVGVMGRLSVALKADAFASIAAGLGRLPGLAASAGSAVAAVPAIIAAAPWAAAAAAIAGVTIGLVKLYEASKNAELAAQTEGAKQDVINRARKAGADSLISYTDAIKYNQAVQDANNATLDRTLEGQRRRIEAQLLIGQITRAQADDELILLGVEQRRQAGLANAPALRKAITDADIKYRDELRNTGLTLGELQASLKENETAFESWAKTAGLSDETLKRLKDSVKDGAKASKDAARDAKELEQAQQALRDALEQTTGVLTQQGLNEELGQLDRLLKLASSQGSPALTSAVRGLHDEFAVLRQKAIDSGLAVEAIDALFNKAAVSSGVLLQGVRSFGTQAPGFMAPVSEANGDLVDDAHAAIRAQGELAEAYRYFGIKSRDELQRTAQEAARNYETLLGSGLATTDQLKAAYQRMIDAQKAATGELPGLWERVRAALPGIEQTITQVNTAVQGTFAQMLLGAKGFKDGMDDIWESMKAGALRIFTEILSDFTNRFLKGLLGALSGQQGAFGRAFGGLFGGGGGGGGLGIPGLGGLFGGGAPVGLTGAGSSPGIAAAGLGFPGGGAAGGAGLGIGAAGIAGGLGAAGAGYGLGRLGQNIFGGAGWGAGTFGAGSGAATGALIGSIVPGLGTAVGAIIGGLAGALGGALGQSQGMKTNDVRDRYFSQFGGAGTGEGSGFHNVAAQLAGVSESEGGGFGGGRLFQDLIKANTLKELEQAVLAVTAALQRQRETAAETGLATEEAAERGESGFTKTGDSVDALREKAEALQQEIDRVNAEGGDTTELTRRMNGLNTIIEALGSTTRLLGGGVDRVTDSDSDVDRLGRSFYDLNRDIERAYQGTVDLGRAIASLPGVPTGTRSTEIPVVEGGAAHGVYANRPGLVLFGEGGQPEVGGPKQFFKQVFDELGVATGRGAGGGLTVAPIAMFFEGRTGFDFTAINQHLASAAGIPSNDFGLRELIEGYARNVVRQEMARRA
jgi:hypothetical protein